MPKNTLKPNTKLSSKALKKEKLTYNELQTKAH